MEGTTNVHPRAVKVIVICAIFLPLATLATGLRLWARRLKKTSLSWNDYLIVLALIAAIAETAIIILAIVMGKVGYHTTSLSRKQVMDLGKTYIAAEPFWISANTLVKLSILHLYLQLFPVVKFCKWVQYTMALVIAYWIAIILRMVLLCRPFRYIWDKTIPGNCVNLPAAYLSVSIINLILDVAVIILPMPMLWNLQMPIRRKIVLSVVFGMGAVICLVTILRIESVHSLSLRDLSYTAIDDAIWSELEPCLGIVNACLPVLQPAFAKISDSKALIWTRWGTKNSCSTQYQGPVIDPRKGSNIKRKSSQCWGDEDYPLREDPSGAGGRHVQV